MLKAKDIKTYAKKRASTRPDNYFALKEKAAALRNKEMLKNVIKREKQQNGKQYKNSSPAHSKT